MSESERRTPNFHVMVENKAARACRLTCILARKQCPVHGWRVYRELMDYFEEPSLVVQIALAADPELARALRPRPLGPGRWVVVVEDWSRERLRDTLADSGWSWDELHAIPMLAGQGREEIPVAPPQV